MNIWTYNNIHLHIATYIYSKKNIAIITFEKAFISNTTQVWFRPCVLPQEEYSLLRPACAQFSNYVQTRFHQTKTCTKIALFHILRGPLLHNLFTCLFCILLSPSNKYDNAVDVHTITGCSCAARQFWDQCRTLILPAYHTMCMINSVQSQTCVMSPAVATVAQICRNIWGSGSVRSSHQTSAPVLHSLLMNSLSSSPGFHLSGAYSSNSPP